MLKIKLTRFGKKGQPMYRVVVNEARDKRDGKYVAKVGNYFPQQQPKVLVLDMEAIDAWIKKGAQPTETVAALIKRYKSGNPFPEKKAQLSKKAKAKLAAEKEAKEAPVEAKAEEVKAEPEAATEAPAKEAPSAEEDPAEKAEEPAPAAKSESETKAE